MPSRRRFVSGVAITVTGISGCSRYTDGAGSLEEVAVILSNNSVESRTFHYALETTGEPAEWSTYHVDESDGITNEHDRPGGSEPVALHAVVDDHAMTSDLRSREGCVELIIEYGNRNEPQILSSVGDCPDR